MFDLKQKLENNIFTFEQYLIEDIEIIDSVPEVKIISSMKEFTVHTMDF